MEGEGGGGRVVEDKIRKGGGDRPTTVMPAQQGKRQGRLEPAETLKKHPDTQHAVLNPFK